MGVMRPLRVLIAEPDRATRAGLRMALDGEPFEVVAEVSDAESAIEAAARLRLDVCLLDVDLPGDALLAAARMSRGPATPAILILSAELDDGELMRAVCAGAVGYLPKDMEPDRLPAVVEAVVSGEAAVPRALVMRLIEELSNRRRRRSAPFLRQQGIHLTAREWDVVELMAEGASTTQVAAALGLSPITVRRHVSQVTRKLGVADRAAAVGLLREQAVLGGP
jgi:two-component system nitrate/nitrite response regulator NarL